MAFENCYFFRLPKILTRKCFCMIRLYDIKKVTTDVNQPRYQGGPGNDVEELMNCLSWPREE